jgi:hypothetical protein
MSLLDDALRVSRTTRKKWLKHLSPEQRTELQAEMDKRSRQLGISTPTKTTAQTAAPRMDEDRYNSIRSGSFVGSSRAIRVGRHVVLIPAAAKWKRVRETAAYVYHRGVVSGYRADGAKLRKLQLDAATRAHIARTMFNVKT